MCPAASSANLGEDARLAVPPTSRSQGPLQTNLATVKQEFTKVRREPSQAFESRLFRTRCCELPISALLTLEPCASELTPSH